MTASYEVPASKEQFAELLPATRRALLHRLAVGQNNGRAPSMVGAVMREGRMVWAEGYGAVDGQVPGADTQYRIGSLTKTFVAVLVLRLRDEGLIDLGDPLGKHLDTPEGGEATIAQLLAHTSGLAAEARGPWWERTDGALRPDLADIFGERPQRHPAGRLHHYSNPGFALLGALVERLRGDDWGTVLRREVLEPLGMDRTTLGPEAPHAAGWAVHPWADALLPEPAVNTGRMAPAGELWSTAADLCRFAAFLLDGDDRVLGAESLAEMRVPAVGPQDPQWVTGYGLGVQMTRQNGRVLFGHCGSMPGFVSALWVSPEESLAGVALANLTNGFEVSALASDLVGTVADHEPRIPAPWRPLDEVDPELLELTGPWYWGATPFALRLCAGRGLELSPLGRGGRGARFRAEADGTWTGLDGYYTGETLRAVRTAAGAPSHLDIGTFVFTREPYEPGDAVPGGVDEGGWR
ncbi:serine hydrolase domain-containing protein [Streptomyces netropsis]|uniref:CubicO group peptidase (Beta-lactamase class C family) n=1 Tax=Streptomyces netropsis TaxID=55404 RepID=A0A7W7PF85_STRNE|nr:serine hydrolase domain-containing protein [Streptomyces netropsis]MBB4887764.1 CubicO group peptidase (beta-lactamase class C family) [Streptomyces netropsis]GGR47654.1 serine hydrolase [Streptomyces netropsis]